MRDGYSEEINQSIRKQYVCVLEFAESTSVGRLWYDSGACTRDRHATIVHRYFDCEQLTHARIFYWGPIKIHSIIEVATFSLQCISLEAMISRRAWTPKIFHVTNWCGWTKILVNYRKYAVLREPNKNSPEPLQGYEKSFSKPLSLRHATILSETRIHIPTSNTWIVTYFTLSEPSKRSSHVKSTHVHKSPISVHIEPGMDKSTEFSLRYKATLNLARRKNILWIWEMLLGLTDTTWLSLVSWVSWVRDNRNSSVWRQHQKVEQRSMHQVET